MTDPVAFDSTFVPDPSYVPGYRDLFKSNVAAVASHKDAVHALVATIVGPEPVAPRSRSPLAQRKWKADHARWQERTRRAEQAERSFWEGLE
jgi:hypothetical protein